MFRKIVSNLPFSPALVGQLSFYAKRLRKEELTRRLGLIFTVLALVVQSLAVFSPPDSANAASDRDFIRGGVSSLSEYLKYYDRNSNNLRDMFSYAGITRAELASAKYTTINSHDGWLSYGRTSPFSASQGNVAHRYNKSGGGTGVMYSKPLRLWDGSSQAKKYGINYKVWVGQSKKMGTFAIMKDCGNLATKRLPTPPKPASSCTALEVRKLSRTSFKITGKASVKDGAKVSSYTYKVLNAAGKTVSTKTIKTSATSSSYTYTQASVGSYKVSLTVQTSLGTRGGASCSDTFTVTPPPAVPAAACTNADAIVSDRTLVQFKGEAVASGGATIKKYTFTVKNQSGETVVTRSVSSAATSVNLENITFSTPGTYTVTLVVDTSVGQKTNEQNCVDSFTIAKPEVCAVNPTLPANSPDCQPCPGNPDIWIKDADCDADIVQTKAATNLSQQKPASTVTAQTSDRITYTLTVENKGYQSTMFSINEPLDDVLEYASLVDTGGGTYDPATKSISWPSTKLDPSAKESRTFVVQVKQTIPATASGVSDRSSYDCRMTNTYGNTVEITLNCPTTKYVEQVVTELPETGPKENMIFGALLFAVVVYFYARSRQLGKEVRLIRRNVTSGAF